MENSCYLYEKPNHHIISNLINLGLEIKIIEDLLIKEKIESNLVSIILEYASIKQKLNSSDDQSWYLKKGSSGLNAKLYSLNTEYQNIQTLFNAKSTDYYIQLVNKNNSFISKFNQNSMNAVAYTSIGFLKSQNKFYNELIRLKSKTKSLLPLEHYLQNPEDLIEIMD